MKLKDARYLGNKLSQIALKRYILDVSLAWTYNNYHKYFLLKTVFINLSILKKKKCSAKINFRESEQKNFGEWVFLLYFAGMNFRENDQ